MKILSVLALFFCSFCLVASNLPCASKWEDLSQGYICVCNSSYCDSVETPDKNVSGTFYSYITSHYNPGIRLSSSGAFNKSFRGHENGIVLKINASVRYQEIVGLGGSISDSAGMVINSLPEKAQNKLIESYFGPTGIEYNILRVPIGGTDFSTRAYTLDDKKYDKSLKHFSLSTEDKTLKIPVIKKAISVTKRDIKLLACTWEAPAWMKINDVGTAQYIKTEYQQTWAQYHIRFLEEYLKQGLEVWALTGGNEVFIEFKWNGKLNQNFTLVTAPVERDWLKNHLKPLLKSSNFSDVKFLALDDNRTYAPYWMARLALDSEALAAVDGIALHTYDNKKTSTQILEDLHDAYPDKPIMYTETSINSNMSGHPVLLGSWDRAEIYIYNLFEAFNHWSVTFLDWNLALNVEGGPTLTYNIDAPVIVNSAKGEFYKQPMFYAMGHFSKFVPPGAVRVQVKSDEKVSSRRQYQNKKTKDALRSSSSDSKSSTQEGLKDQDTVLNVAFTNPDGSCTVIMFNTDRDSVPVTIEDSRVGSMSITLEKRSLHTVIYWP